MKRKTILCLCIIIILTVYSNVILAHELDPFGSEDLGYLYKGSHWESKNTDYISGVSNLYWNEIFELGIWKFEYETNIDFNIEKVSNSFNYIDDVIDDSVTWVGLCTFYYVQQQHPNRWSIKFNEYYKDKYTKAEWITIAAHEIGHVFGLDDLYEPKNDDKLMYGYANGIRNVTNEDNIGFGLIYK